MRFLLLLAALVSVCSSSFAQQSLEEIFNSSRDFQTIVRQGEAYFQAKYPDLPLYELTEGQHRDSEFVKFMRWRAFWSERLEADGSLGDISAYNRGRVNIQQRFPSPYADIDWTNISYENYIVSQIGLGRTTSIAFHPSDPNTFIVGAAIGGVWKTEDGGQTYQAIGDNLPFLAVSAVLYDAQTPTTMYAAVSDHVWYGPSSIGIYKTTDGGQNWLPTALNFEFDDRIRIYWMEAAPGNPDHILVTTSDGAFRTTDGFNSVDNVFSSSCFHVRFKPSDANTVYLGATDGNLYRSLNGGASFDTMFDLGSGAVHLDVSPAEPNSVFAATGNQLHISTDEGQNFSPAAGSLFGGSVFKVARNNPDIIVHGNFEVGRSNNRGANFNNLTHWLGNDGLPSIHVDQRNMFTNPLQPDYIYLCNDGGVYRYQISTSTFDNLCDGLAITQFYDIAVAQSDPNIVGGGSQDNGNVFRDSNGNWVQYAGTGDGMNQEIDPTNADVRFWSYQYGAIRRWSNGGNTNIAPSGQSGEGAWETPFKLDPNNPNRLIIGYDQVYESLNQGDSWTTISGQLAGGSNLNELAIAPSNGQRIYVSNHNTLYVKDVNSNNWTSKSMPASISDLEVDFLDMNTIYITIPGYTQGSKVYKSTDAGDNWENISLNLPNVSTGALELVANIQGGLFIGNDLGVYYKDDQAQIWLEYGDLPHTRVEDIEIQYAAELIRVGTHGRGILEAPLEVDACTAASPDDDNDGICNFIDQCPDFDNSLIGTGCDDGDPFSQGEQFTVNCNCTDGADFGSYCAAQGSSGTGSDWISQVILNTIDHSSGKSQYSDFRQYTTRLNHGQSYPIEVRLNATFNTDRVHVWIDFDRNEIFDTDEKINMSVPQSRLSTGLVEVPLDAVRGATSMRVRGIYSTSIEDPCGSYAGEVEDYTVSLQCVANSTGNDCTALPLEWLNFEATSLGSHNALLRWATVDESAISHFLIERSVDGTRFETIGQLSPNNTSGHHSYQFIDEQIAARIAYYRITSLDLDGSTDRTPIQLVQWGQLAAETISIYPNPVRESLQAQWELPETIMVDWKIYSVEGQLLLQGQVVNDAVQNVLSIDAPSLKPGAYLLHLQAGGREASVNFVKD